MQIATIQKERTCVCQITVGRKKIKDKKCLHWRVKHLSQKKILSWKENAGNRKNTECSYSCYNSLHIHIFSINSIFLTFILGERGVPSASASAGDRRRPGKAKAKANKARAAATRERREERRSENCFFLPFLGWISEWRICRCQQMMIRTRLIGSYNDTFDLLELKGMPVPSRVSKGEKGWGFLGGGIDELCQSFQSFLLTASRAWNSSEWTLALKVLFSSKIFIFSFQNRGRTKIVVEPPSSSPNRINSSVSKRLFFAWKYMSFQMRN